MQTDYGPRSHVNKVAQGSYIICPNCSKVLAYQVAGYKSHLSLHVKKKELTVEQLREMMDKKFPNLAAKRKRKMGDV